MQKHKNIFFYCGLLMLFSEVWKQWCLTYILNNGHYNWWYFPFQLCSIPMYICLILPWIRSPQIYDAFLTFLMDFGMLGGIFAFCDTSGMYYHYPPLTIHSFAWHVLLIILGLYAGFTISKSISIQNYLKSAGIYLICCVVATIWNLLFHPYGNINMFYISPYYIMAQKVFCKLALILGNNAGIAIYIASTLFGAWIFHCIWMFLKRGLKISVNSLF